MRSITGVLRPVDRLHPTIPALSATPDVTPIAIHQTRLLDDGTEVTLLDVRGDLDRLEAALADVPSLIEFEIAGERDGTVYCHSEPHDRAKHLLSVQSKSDLVVRTPLRFTGDGGLRVTLLGDDADFQRAVEQVPGDLEFEVERIGEYSPAVDGLRSALTERQREVLEVAIREGYYENPRQASQREVAEILGITPGTVSQTLRRIEANVFAEFVVEDRPAEG